MNGILRKGEPADAEQILRHTKKVLAESSFLLTTPEEFTNNYEQQIEWINSHNEPGHLLLVAEKDGEIIGLLNFARKQRKRIAHLGYFGISIQADYCNLGIGRKMIEYLLGWAKQEPGIEKVCLEVFSHNTRAIHLYKKLGFIEEGRKKDFIKYEDGTYVDEVLMYQFVK